MVIQLQTYIEIVKNKILHDPWVKSEIGLRSYPNEITTQKFPKSLR